MPAQHVFSVKQDENGAEHKVTATVKTFAEATESQRKTMWDEGMAAATVKVQGTLRRRLAKGVRGKALDAEATAAFKSIIESVRTTAAFVVDAKVANLTPEQVAFFEAQGAVVINKPESK